VAPAQPTRGKATGAVSGVSVSMDVSDVPMDPEYNSAGVDCPMSTVQPSAFPLNPNSQANVEVNTASAAAHLGPVPDSSAAEAAGDREPRGVSRIQTGWG
jgi:hypothetical protein